MTRGEADRRPSVRGTVAPMSNIRWMAGVAAAAFMIQPMCAWSQAAPAPGLDQPPAAAAPAPQAAAPAAQSNGQAGRVFSSPLARRLAKEAGIDVT
ncbi:E3 binding domain-containing protein, partial [Pseudomonas sp. EA_65y_Pfl1_P113]|uniref:E3 binding domain-containing protein n=1 Tax=Pseudomonas sp. EA_65y_Pfl1_P113 TaxID=3088692 RepID=UPI0030DDBF88